MATNASLLLFEITENASVKLCGSISHPLFIELLKVPRYAPIRINSVGASR